MATMNIECTVCGRKDLYTTTEFETEIVKEPTATEEGLKKYTAVIDVDGVEFTDEYTEAIYRTSAVATIGDTPYYRLIDAIEAVKLGDTITVLDDIDEPNVGYGDFPYIDKAFTLDLNGHSVTAKSITTSNDLTIKNGTFSGDITNNSGDGMAKYAITLDNAAVNSFVFRWAAKNIVIKNGSTLNITDGEIYLGAYYEEISLVLDKTSAIVLTNAEIGAGEDDIELKELTAAEIEKYFPAGYSLKYDEDNSLYYITNADGNKVTNAVELLAENFVVNKVEAKAATCEEDGCIEYYTDTHGNLYIEQNGAYIKEKAENVIIPALGHSWGEPAYKWSVDYTTCTRTYVCQNDSTHIKTKTVDTVIENGIATATFDKEIKKYSHTDNIDDTGKASEDYGVSLDTRDTVKIDGAKKLSVKLKYDTEPGWDFVYVYKNPDDVKPMTVTEGEEEVPLELSDEGEKTFEVDGDEVTFRFTSDESNVKYGYYAVVTATVDDVRTKEVKQILLGDVNFDEKVDNEDAALVLKYISTGKAFYPNDEEQNERAILAANADSIGNVDMLDVIAILQRTQQA